jgi:UDP-N-acetylmuramate dehydrogenase
LEILQNVSLKDHTTFKIGGLARYFVITKNTEDLIKAIEFAQDKDLPYFILGGGSNLLVNDQGFDGVVIKNQNSEIKIQNHRAKYKTIYTTAGTQLGKLVEFSIEKGLTGLEWAAGIPGTVGGAIRGNAGAFGSSIAELVKEVKVWNKDFQFSQTTPGLTIFNSQDCQFGYRDSIFKHSDNIIFSAELELKKGDKKKSQQMIKKYLQQRKEKQPLEYPSAGCIFKNPKPLSAAQLIEQVGLKGKKVGQAMISEKHANFIINLGRAQAKDVRKLVRLIKVRVKKKFNIELEEEIQYIGF